MNWVEIVQKHIWRGICVDGHVVVLFPVVAQFFSQCTDLYVNLGLIGGSVKIFEFRHSDNIETVSY